VVETQTSAEAVAGIEGAYQVRSGIYLIGSLERGGTVYSQQVRAHNLAWALWSQHKAGLRRVSRVAVIGGGIAGLTITACVLSLFDQSVSVCLFEQLSDLCPLQQGSDARWLHPRIYEWPAEGSKAPGASLPVLNWSEGRASDVCRTIIRQFGEYCSVFAKSPERLTAYLALQHFQIDSEKNSIQWVANRATRSGEFFHLGPPEGGTAEFDTIILAVGFGLETRTPKYPTDSYWRNEQLGQPTLDGSQRRYLISGFGDGALIDLCRLTIERFRQDTLLYELFDPKLDHTERRMLEEREKHGADANSFQLLKSIEDELLASATRKLRDRIRKDTRVVLHLRGKNNDIKSFSQIFGPRSSFFNRMMTFMLFRCGAFGIDFSDLATTINRHHIPHNNVVCRYGANTMDHLSELFIEPEQITTRLSEIKDRQEQLPQELWPPGTFPHLTITAWSDR
jgi:hypothetical protein